MPSPSAALVLLLCSVRIEPATAVRLFRSGNLFGGPSHRTRRASATKFWGLDMSGGVGSLSSPVLAEHPKNASEAAMFYERLGSRLASRLPPWLLLSTVSVVTREIATRQVQQGIVPALVADAEAKPKADFLARKLRSNFDKRIQRMLAPGGYGNAQRLVKRFVDAELDELESTIRSIDDVIEHEITKAIMEVVEVETIGRIQGAISDAVKLNQSSAALDLEEILAWADADGNERITFDELYELISGGPIDPCLAPLAREVTVLTSTRASSNRWDRWRSLLIAPQVKNVARASALLRRLYERGERQMPKAILDGLISASRELESSFSTEMQRLADTISANFAGTAYTPPDAAAAAAAAAAHANSDQHGEGDGEGAGRLADEQHEQRRRWWKPWSWKRRRRSNTSQIHPRR